MTITLNRLAGYLGGTSVEMFSDPPFRGWTFNISVEEDLPRPLIDYVFPENGLDVTCDEEGRVRSIFIYADKSRNFSENIVGFSFSHNRNEVISLLGSPSKSGKAINDPILGVYGAWDRFSFPGYSIHIEYSIDAVKINKVTLMRADAVP